MPTNIDICTQPITFLLAANQLVDSNGYSAVVQCCAVTIACYCLFLLFFGLLDHSVTVLFLGC